MVEFLDETPLFCDDSFDDSFSSNGFDEPNSVNLNLENGSPLGENNFICLHFNINSITAEGRLEQLSSICKTLKVGCLALTESKLDDSIPTSSILIEGMYEPLRRDRTRHGGGCLLYIAQAFTFKQRTDLQSDKYEHICADIQVRDKLYTINTLYRPPNESRENHIEFTTEIEGILSKVSQNQSNTKIFLADFNFENGYCKFPTVEPKTLDTLAPIVFSGQGYEQLIDIPT